MTRTPFLLAYLSIEPYVVFDVLANVNRQRARFDETPITVSVDPCRDLMIGGEACHAKISGSVAVVMAVIGILEAHGHDCLLSAER